MCSGCRRGVDRVAGFLQIGLINPGADREGRNYGAAGWSSIIAVDSQKTMVTCCQEPILRCEGVLAALLNFWAV